MKAAILAYLVTLFLLADVIAMPVEDIFSSRSVEPALTGKCINVCNNLTDDITTWRACSLCTECTYLNLLLLSYSISYYRNFI